MGRRDLLFTFLITVFVLTSCALQQPTFTPTALPLPTATLAPTQVATPSATTVIESPTRWWDDCIFYEVLVRSFYDSDGDGYGDLEGLIQKLDYLNDGDPETTGDLGITGLWLMPICEATSYHGYDVTDYFSVESDYGDESTFHRLVEEAHKRGIYVIVDMVLNHTSEKHPWFVNAQTGPQAEHYDWYIWSETNPSYKGPWGQDVWFPAREQYYYGVFGKSMPDLNYRNEEVTAQMLEVVRFWLEDMGADGLRLDAIKHLIEEDQRQENTQSTHDWLRRFRAFYKNVKPDAFVVGEVWSPTKDVAPYVGDQLDACFEFDLASAILTSINEGSPARLKVAQLLVENSYRDHQYAIFLSNHDQVRVFSQLGRSEEKARLAATIYLTSPGIPFIYYGEEIGMAGNKPDLYIRKPMQWSDAPRAGFTTGIPWTSVNLDYTTKNVTAQQDDPDSLLNHYKRLIRLRMQHAALRTGSFTLLGTDNRLVYAYLRHNESEDIVVVLNFSDKPIESYALSAREGSPMKFGTYVGQELLTGEDAGEVRVTSAGGFQGYKPVPVLSPRAGYVILLKRQ
ncbi:MAG: alpha-glucosidase C-terminal domain-containing protein [Chloroflexi bacterium]|nr:alpha-glucosidase C-terminal domain-containing protein [Chloroflexota bacterium]